MQRAERETYLNQYLDVSRFRDYCPNGLQVEGRAEVGTIVTGVSASLDLLRATQERGADAVLVHHGYFWRGEDPRVTRMRRERLALLVIPSGRSAMLRGAPAPRRILSSTPRHAEPTYTCRVGFPSRRCILRVKQGLPTYRRPGHHATERYGIQALGAHLAARFGIKHAFVDVPNPV